MPCWEGEQIEGPSDHQSKRHLHVTLTPARGLILETSTQAKLMALMER